jgi:hypothetical protein
MANNPDYIPRAGRKFEDWVIVLVETLGEIQERVKFPADVYASLVTLKDDFVEKFKLANGPMTRTMPAVTDKNTARDALKRAVRQAVNEYLTHNHLLTEVDRDNLGLPIHKRTHTHAPVAEHPPIFTFDTSTVGRVHIHFHALDTHRGRPRGQRGVEIGWVVSDTPVKYWSELQHMTTSTHAPCTLSFNVERGHRLYVALRWENTRGEKGPWSEIYNTIIP